MSDMLSVKEAAASILDSLSALSVIKKPLDKALGFALAEDIPAERDYPPFDRITMDGIAIAYASFASGRRAFPIEGYAAAGSPPLTLQDAHYAIEVGTGAPLPAGCDTVIPYEVITIADKVATLKQGATVSRGDALHARASDAKAGQILLKVGQKIGLPEIAVLAGNGVGQVPVYTKPSIGILATGNELVASDGVIEPYQIRRSNDQTLAAALRLNGFDEVLTSWAADDKDAIAAELSRYVNHTDVVLITGGVSKGARDYVPEVLVSLGVTEIFHRVAQRPGKPLWFGRTQHSLVFGLPGNPNSSLTCLMRYVLPALQALSGGMPSVIRPKKLLKSIASHASLALFVPVALTPDDHAQAMSTRTSGDFTGMLGSDGFVEIPAGSHAHEADFYPWRQA